MESVPSEEGERRPPDELPKSVAERQRKREKIRAYLRGKHSRYLPWYEGALYTHEDSRNPDRIRQTAHSLRDLSNRLIEDLLPEAILKKNKQAKSKGKSKKDAFADLIEIALAGVGDGANIPDTIRPHLRAIARQWVKVHKRLVSIAHNGTDNSLELTPLMNEFEDIVWASFQATPDRVEEIDDLLKEPVPGEQTLKTALRLLTNQAAQDYFYESLEHPGWLKPLLNAKAFANSPGLLRRGDTIQFPHWSALTYLKKVANHSPDLVVKIVKGLDSIENALVMGKLVEILGLIPISASSKVTHIIIKWLRQPYQLFIHRQTVKLFDYYAKESNWDIAKRLLPGLLALNLAPPKKKNYFIESTGFAQDFEIEEFLHKHLPPLAIARPHEVALQLEETLAEALCWERKQQSARKKLRGTSHWRSTIEATSQSQNHNDYKNAILCALRDALRAFGRNRHPQFSETMRRLLNHREWIFKRLAIDAIRENRDAFPKLRDTLLRQIPITSDSAYVELLHEYHLFVSESLGGIKHAERERFLDRLTKKFDALDSDEKEEPTSPHRIYRFLLGVEKHLHPESKYANRLAEMKASYGALRMDPSLLMSFSSARVCDESPLAAHKILALSVKDLVKEIKSFKEPEKPRSMSLRGLASSLGEAVKTDPQRFAKSLHMFQDSGIKPVYLTRTIHGFEDALKAKRLFDWNPVLNLCAHLAKIESAEELPSENDPEDVYEGVYGAIAHLFQTGLSGELGRMTVTESERARDILLEILRHPLGPGEKRYSDNDHDATAASINTFHGQAIHALMRYLMFRWNLLTPGPTLRRVDGLSNLLTPEIRRALESQLESPEATPALHAAMGWHFPVLTSIDKTWAEGIRHKIFDPAKPTFWEGAWDGFITFNQVYTDLLEPMRSHYERAIEIIPERAVNNREDKESLNHLAQHLLIAKVHGLSFGPGPNLLSLLYAKAGPELRQHAAWFISRCLEDDEAKPRAWEALRGVIESRVAWAETVKDLQEIGTEIVALADCLDSAPVALAEAAPLLRRMFPFFQGAHYGEEVVKHLCEQARTEPLLAVELLAELFSKRLGQFDLWSSECTLIKLLTEAKQSTDERVSEKARIIATIFFEGGHIPFRDLMR